MAYGLEIFNKDSELIFSSADQTILQIDQYQVGANETVSNTYSLPGTFSLTVQLQPVNIPPDSGEGYTPFVSISGLTVTVGPFGDRTSEATNVLVLGTGIDAEEEE